MILNNVPEQEPSADAGAVSQPLSWHVPNLTIHQINEAETGHGVVSENRADSSAHYS